jgi:hypothetical protein
LTIWWFEPERSSGATAARRERGGSDERPEAGEVRLLRGAERRGTELPATSARHGRGDRFQELRPIGPHHLKVGASTLVGLRCGNSTNRRFDLVHDQVDRVGAQGRRLESPLRHSEAHRCSALPSRQLPLLGMVGQQRFHPASARFDLEPPATYEDGDG